MQMLSACGNGETQESQQPAEESGATSTASTEPAEVTYPVEGNPTISMVRVLDGAVSQAGYTSYSECPGFISWQEQSGIKVELQEPVDNAALLLLLASGETPDVIVANRDFYSGGALKMAQDGYAIDIKDLLPQYAPDYWAFLNSDEVYMKSMIQADGSIRSVGGYSFEKDSPYRSWRGLVVRKEFMDQLGMEEIETVDEFYTFLKRCKDELGVDIPFCSDKNNFNKSTFFTEGVITSGFGLVNSGPYVKDGQYHHGAYEPEYKDFLAFLHQLYAEGLLDNNFAVTDEPTAQASMINGETAVMYSSASRIQVMTQASGASDFNLVGITNLVKNKGDRAMFSKTDAYVTTGYWTFIPEASENVEAVLNFCNYLFTEEGNLLYNFGTEGRSYTMVDGKPVYTELVTNNEKYALDPMIRTEGLMNWFGIMNIEMSEQRFPMQAQRDAYEAWAQTDVDKYSIINNGILPELVNENASLAADIDTYIDEMRAKFISGVEPLDNFDQYIATLKGMGMDRLLEIRQQSYEAFNK